MTGLEYDNFKKLDEKKYILTENEEFRKFIEENENTYIREIGLESLQKMMSDIVSFFEFKYPNALVSKILFNENHEENEKTLKISDMLDMKQLKYRLHDEHAKILDCSYEGYIVLQRQKRNPGHSNICAIHVDDNGFVDKNNIDDLKEAQFLQEVAGIERIEDLYGRFESVDSDIDHSDIKKFIYNHKEFVSLRNKILKLIPLYMIYSENTMPAAGYFRAKKFIEMFNKEYNLNLNSEEIDKIMAKDYKNIEFTDYKKMSKMKKY